ncbi:hypothetical protein SAMN02799624_03741 [Paenibacillus sp. UNC496MF]|uniref:hypothetical protein n=1 Tax=Paenibacillus sp. UNC496MF TaxID=1502753 RepID=UPI0008E2D26D|nr:hypothetical protein [Paenibacillus sp. UNC496MF]SFJ23321.1 hypothetical protein SAMN02799624_03741 [Paenibacillus sp. UNC496MF]
MSYDDFAFLLRFNHIMTFGTLTPRTANHGTVFELLKGRLPKAAGAGPLRAGPGFAAAAGPNPRRTAAGR